MQQLITTIQKLKSDSLHAVKVVDCVTGKVLVNNATGKELAERSGSVEAFFEGLNATGVKMFRVNDRRQNGSTFKCAGEAYTVNSQEDQQPEPQPKQQPAMSNNIALQNPFANFGMNGGLNMMDVSYKYQDHHRLTTENADMKAKIERLEKENRDLENKNLRNELAGEKSSANKEMVKEFVPMLGQILPLLLSKGSAAPGLAMPQDAGLSEIKQQFMQVVQISPDQTLEVLASVAQGFANNEFSQELYELLTKHNLIENG